MSVWGSGDAEYFRAAIFRGSYTFRMARIETFSGRSGCQGTGLFFPPFPHQLTVVIFDTVCDDSLFVFSYFYTIVFQSTHLPFLTYVRRNKGLNISLAIIGKDRHNFQCAMSCMWMAQWNQSGLPVQCRLSPVQSNHVWHSGLFF